MYGTLYDDLGFNSAGDISIRQYGADPSNSAVVNTAAIQNAFNDGIAFRRPVRIPAGRYPIVGGALTINGNLTIIGDFVAGNWNGGINVPLGSPPTGGAVLCPTSNGLDVITISDASRVVNIRDVGIEFQNPFVGTGNGIVYTPGLNVQGLTDSRWDNVMVYGHDGDHYAYKLTNFILCTFVKISSYGGGGFQLSANTNAGLYGNSTFVQPYAQVIVGGAAHGYDISANFASGLNLTTFIRPQAIVQNQFGVSPAGNPPTSAQFIWKLDTNVKTVNAIAADLETTVGSSIQLGTPALQNDMGWSTLSGDFANVLSPAWGDNGVLYGPLTRTVTDTTSSGTVASASLFAMPGTHVAALSPTTYTNLSTLTLGVPIGGTNVTATSHNSLLAYGTITGLADISSATGFFLKGNNSWLNRNATTNTTSVGDGTTSGRVSIGGPSNIVSVGNSNGTALATTATTGFPTIPSMAGAPTGVVSVPAGTAAAVYDTTNSKLWLSTGGGTWKGVVVA